MSNLSVTDTLLTLRLFNLWGNSAPCSIIEEVHLTHLK